MKENVKEKLITAWRIIVAMGMISITALAIIFGYLFYKHEIRNSSNRTWTERSEYSDKYEYEHTPTTVRLKSNSTGKYLTPALSNIFTDNLKDSITVFFQDKKRGFLNIYSGDIVVPAQFDKAWVFSEQLGAAVKDGKLGFINNKGETVIPFQFGYRNQWKDQVDFLFKNGYCTVLEPVTGKHGLIDKNGKWVVLPQYDYINNPRKGFRLVKLNNQYGVMDSTFQFTLPIQYDWITYQENGFLLQSGYEKQLIAYDGKTVLQPFVYDNVYPLTYGTDKVDSDGNIILAKCDMNSYEVAGRYGLMDKNGKIITKPLYTAIDAISKDVFVCDLDYGGPKITLANPKKSD